VGAPRRCAGDTAETETSEPLFRLSVRRGIVDARSGDFGATDMWSNGSVRVRATEMMPL
jgi:hypothetical protein